MNLGVFSPSGANVTLAVGVASSNVALSSAVGTLGGVARMLNIGTNVIHFAFGGTSGVTASIPGSIPMGPNSEVVFDIPAGTTHVAAIAGATGNTLYIQWGIGM